MSSLALTFNNSPISTINHNSQIWLTSVELAKALDYAHENAVTKIYNRYKDEFTDSMSTILPSTQIGSHGDSSGVQRIFSLRGCHLLAMLSRTKIAKEFRKWVLDILDNQLSSNPLQLEPKTKKALPNGLTLEQQDCIKALVRQRVAELPKDKQAKAAITCWSSIKSKYGKTYKAVEPEHFTNIVSLLGRLPLEGELVEKPKQDALTINLKFPDGMRTMTMQFETSEFQHGRWLVSLMDGNLSIQAMTEYELSMTMDQWIRYATRDLGYVVIKKDEFHVGNFVMEQLPAHLLPILVEKAGRRLSAIRV